VTLVEEEHEELMARIVKVLVKVVKEIKNGKESNITLHTLSVNPFLGVMCEPSLSETPIGEDYFHLNQLFYMWTSTTVQGKNYALEFVLYFSFCRETPTRLSLNPNRRPNDQLFSL
jgi:hypothetical protein